MAGETVAVQNDLISGAVENVTNSISHTFSSTLSQALAPIMPVLKAIGIAFLVYIIFLIIKAFVSMRTNSRIKKICNNVQEINEKLDLFIGKRARAREKKK